MLKAVLDVTVPCLTFLLMVVVGLELTPADLGRVARRLPVVALATAAQVILWPLAAALVVMTLRPQPYVAAGVLLVAACPSGSMANLYTYLGRADLALSVSLTAVSCLAAVVTMPLLLALVRNWLEEPSALAAPVPLMMGQLFLMLIVPATLGLLARRAWPELTARYGRALLVLALAGLAAIITLVVVREWGNLAGDFMEISFVVIILTAIMLLSGHIAGLFCALEARDRFSLAMVLVVRNVAIATAVAVTVLGRTEFAVFATAYFLNQVPLLLAALGLFRLLVPQGSASKRGDHEPARHPVR